MLGISLTPVEWYFVPQVLVGGPDHIQFSVAWKHKIYKEPHHSLELKQYENVSLKGVLTSLLWCTPKVNCNIILTARWNYEYFALSSIKYFRSCAIGLNMSCDQIFPAKTGKLGNIWEYPPIFKTAYVAKKIISLTKTIASIWGENMLGYLSLDILFLKLRTRKTVCFSEQIMSANKYPSIFLCKWGLLFI